MTGRKREFSSGDLDGPLWLGIDQSLSGFGMCVLDGAGNYYAEVLSPTTRGAERLHELSEQLGARVLETKPEDVALEGTVVRSPSASVLGELAGVIKLVLYQHDYSPLIVPPLTLKRFCTGTAKSTKSQMLLSAYKRYGVDITDDNAVDAYCLARIVRGEAANALESNIISMLSDPKYRE